MTAKRWAGLVALASALSAVVVACSSVQGFGLTVDAATAEPVVLSGCTDRGIDRVSVLRGPLEELESVVEMTWVGSSRDAPRAVRVGAADPGWVVAGSLDGADPAEMLRFRVDYADATLIGSDIPMALDALRAGEVAVRVHDGPIGTAEWQPRLEWDESLRSCGSRLATLAVAGGIIGVLILAAAVALGVVLNRRRAAPGLR